MVATDNRRVFCFAFFVLCVQGLAVQSWSVNGLSMGSLADIRGSLMQVRLRMDRHFYPQVSILAAVPRLRSSGCAESNGVAVLFCCFLDVSRGLSTIVFVCDGHHGHHRCFSVGGEKKGHAHFLLYGKMCFLPSVCVCQPGEAREVVVCLELRGSVSIVSTSLVVPAYGEYEYECSTIHAR